MGQISNPAKSSAIKALKRVPERNLNNICRRKTIQEVIQANPNSGRTQGGIVRCPAKEFYAVRIGIPNSEATPPTVTAIAVAVTASNTSISVPTTGNTLTNDGATGWVQGKFNGSNSSALAAAGPDLNTPSITYTDWIEIQSIPATDSGVLTPYLMMRIKIDTAFTYVPNPVDDSTSVNTKALYHDFYRSSADGEFVTNPGGLTAQSASGNTPFYVVEFETSYGVIRIACNGDSITAGKHASDQQGGAGGGYKAQRGWWQQMNDYFVAQHAASGGTLVNLYQNAVGGMTTAQSLIYGAAENDSSPGAVQLVSLFSPNDGPSGANFGGFTQKTMNLMYARAMQLARRAKANGTMVIFTILAPNNVYNTTDDALVLALIARIKNSGYLVLDLSPAVSDGATPRRFKTTPALLGDSDGIHPITPGYTAMAQYGIPILISLLRQGGLEV